MSNTLTITAPEGVPYIDFEREFDVPVEALFRAHSDPDLFRQWIGPDGIGMDLKEYDFSTGGRYHYVHTATDGQDYEFRGVFHVVRDNEFAVQTFEYLGYPDQVAIETLTFEDLGGGRSRLRGHSSYPSQEGRDGMVASGMEGGMTEGYDKLEKLVSGA